MGNINSSAKLPKKKKMLARVFTYKARKISLKLELPRKIYGV